MTKCAICYQKNHNHKTKCGHHFCLKCLRKWEQQHSILHYNLLLQEDVRFTTCPLCRRDIRVPEYPNTRSCANKSQVVATLQEMFTKQGNMIDSSKYVVEILEYIWKMRVIFRQYDNFSRLVVAKTKDLESQYKSENKHPPPILFHIRTHWGV